MSYVYLESMPQLWTVGFYDPSGKWQPESDHESAENAAARVHWLNGGGPDAGPRATITAENIRIENARLLARLAQPQSPDAGPHAEAPQPDAGPKSQADSEVL